MNLESQRLQQAREATSDWKKWGPYLSERQWGTVREDYSEGGNAWDYFTHDQARSRAYHWGEDGLAGISDDRQRLCFALALWNGQDPIIKERLFGLTNSEGNHGEDVKEYYFYLDSTPTHSYMKYLYKYPQSAYPYSDLVLTNRQRGKGDLEYELLDTGVFDDDRYFDVFVEYAKSTPDDILIEITIANRGSEAATLQVMPTLWFRNTWSWGGDVEKPQLSLAGDASPTAVVADDQKLGLRYFYCDGTPQLLFTENESNTLRLSGIPNSTPYVKDGINNYVVNGQADAVNPAQSGTKVAAQYVITVGAGESQTLRLRISDIAPGAIKAGAFGREFTTVMKARRDEADEFYADLTPASLSEDEGRILRQALAGMMWSKQFYYYDLNRWLSERGSNPYQVNRRSGPRNDDWHHMYNADVISMPDKWEYPWYAAWDLAFHVVALTMVDPEFGKQQLDLMLCDPYIHPNGQIPAYEWNFGDVNPPVHAWATIFTYRLEQGQTGKGDVEWLHRCFQKLLLNFTWWVNRKDRSGKNVFEGGFLGLDNIGVFDRSSPLPTGGYLEQADGTAWMALYCQNMMEIAIELAMTSESFGDMALKFTQHFLWIAAAMSHAGNDTGMWDEEDGFFYDVLRLPNGESQRLKVRSMVGLLPLCAATVFDGEIYTKYPEIADRLRHFFNARPELMVSIHDPRQPGYKGRRLASILDERKLRRVLEKMLDENEFLSSYGIRALSRFHVEHPYVFQVGNQEYRVSYLPAESDSGMFGGNSNWRGPIWMPVNALLIRSLLQYYAYYGNDFKVECPTGSGTLMTLYEVAEEISRRLSQIFVRDEFGRRAVFGGSEKFQSDPHWRDCLQFFEYFHGDNGAGLGASHQTGWTGIIARALHLFATLTPEQVLESGKKAYSHVSAAEPPATLNDPAPALAGSSP